MWSFDDEFGDLPEIDPGEDFMKSFSSPVVLNKEVVRSNRNEEVVVSDKVVDVLSQAPQETLAILGANEIVRVPQVERKWYQVTPEGDALKIEGGAEVSGFKEVLIWARDNNLSLFRDLVFKNYSLYLEYAQQAEPEEALLWYRMLRSVTPVLNLISKKIEVMPAGLSTLTKIRYALDYAFELGAPRSVVGFGIGNFTHAMAYHPDIVMCVDTDSWSHGSERGYFVRGDLRDWKKYVDRGDMILSDCSIGSDQAMGMEIPRAYYDVYKEMVQAGFYVLAKINKLSLPLEENWSVATIVYYREHNMEAFVLLSPLPDQNVYKMQDLDILDRMRDANDYRMRRILSREFNTQGVTFNYTERDLAKALKIADITYRTGEKNYSVIRDVFHRYSDNLGRDWRRLCMDRDIKCMEFKDFLEIPVELPCILIDVEYLAADKERLFASFHQKCVMEWYDDIGWVAVEMKN